MNPPAETPPQKAAILLVDDRRENLIAMEALLGDFGEIQAELVMATSGEEALRKVLRQDFAVILLDVQMPGMDGLETASLIRARQQSRHTPIVFVTAYQQEAGIVARGYELGAVDFLFKPVVGEILRSKVRVFVNLWLQAREIERQAEKVRDAEAREIQTRLLARLESERQQWEASRLESDLQRERQFRQELEQSYRRLQDLEGMRDDLAHMIVHDLRSPLCSFLTGLETLRTCCELPEDHLEILDLSISGGHQLLRMINDLLDIARLEAGQLPLLTEPCDVEALMRDAVRSIQSLAEAKELAVEIQVQSEVPEWIVDGEKVRRVLVNLIGNAVKFSPRKERIVVSAATTASGLRLAVRDFGEGIPQEAFERIFDKFGQVESRKRGRGASTGLGLTFCRLVSEAHGGRIWVESELGRGSTFCVELPPLAERVPITTVTPDPQRNEDAFDEGVDDEAELPLAA